MTRTIPLVALTGAIAAAGFAAAPASALTGPHPTFTYVSHLEALLPTPDQLGRITRASAPMRVVGSAAELLDSAAGNLEPARCIGAYEPGHREAYRVAGPTSVATQLVTDGKPGRARHFVNQTVLSAASPDAAAGQVRASTRAWSSCGERVVAHTNTSGAVTEWALGAAELHRNDTVLVQRQVGRHVICERAMTAANGTAGAVIADVVACDLRGADPTGRAEQIAVAIAHNSQPAN